MSTQVVDAIDIPSTSSNDMFVSATDVLGNFDFDLLLYADHLDNLAFQSNNGNAISYQFDVDNNKVTNTVTKKQQNRSPIYPTRKKRHSSSSGQPRVKRQKIEHSHVCNIHQPLTSKPTVRCFGNWSITGRYRGSRCTRMVATFIDGQLPVCAHHNGQIMKMVRCKAILDCGFSCNEIVSWKPHGYALCQKHWSQGKCYFLELLPVEIRFMIYEYLLPDKWVAARSFGQCNVLQDRYIVSRFLLRLNRKIHDEVAHLLYGQPTFEIHVANEGILLQPRILMCNSNILKNRQPGFSLSETHNRNRLLSGITARHLAARASPRRLMIRRTLTFSGEHDSTTWQPPLALQYFQQIKSFRISIEYNTQRSFLLLSERSQGAEAIRAESERNYLCDYLHRIVDCIITHNQSPLRKLEINIQVEGLADTVHSINNSKALEHCEALIKPLKRLRTRATEVISLTRLNGARFNLLPIDPNADNSITKCWPKFRQELSSSLVPPPKSLILLRFEQLVKLLSQMYEYHNWREEDIDEMESLLNDGRTAREAENRDGLRAVFASVFNMLNKLNSDHQNFMKQMKQNVEILRDSKST